MIDVNYKLVERLTLGSLLILLLILPAGVTVGLRNTLAILVAFSGLLLLWHNPRELDQRQLPAAFILWIGIMLASCIWSWEPIESLRRSVLEVLVPVCGMVAAWHLSSCRTDRALWAVVLTGPLIVEVAGVGVVSLTGTAGLYDPSLRLGWLAAYPGVGVATTVAVLILPFGLAGVQQKDHLIKRLSAISLGAILLVGLISQNRMIWPALMFTGGVQMLLVHRDEPATRRRAHWILIGILGGACVLVLGWFVTQKTRFSTSPSVDGLLATLTDDGRWAAWKIWLSKGSEHPVLGFGYGKRLIPSHIDPPYREQLAAIGPDLTGHAHNILLNMWLQTGFLGLVAFVIVFIALFRYLLGGRLGRQSRYQAGATIGIAVLIGFLVKNMTDDFYGYAVAQYFWLLVGIALRLHDSERELPLNSLESSR